MPAISSHGKNNRPLIDILLPVHNGAPFLAKSIVSIQAQTETSWRLLVLDDGSTDRSAAIAKKFAARDSRIQLVRFPARGLIATLNAGLKLCRAPFVARQDADDLSVSDRFALELEYLNSHPKCIAVSGGGITIDGNGKQIGGSWFKDPHNADPYWIPAREPYLTHPFLMVRREIYQRLGYRNFFMCEDADLCWRLEEAGAIHSLPKVLGRYRTFEKSVSTRLAVNTRVQAIVSQLAAIGARRRRKGNGDFNLSARLREKIFKAKDFEAIVEVFRPSLSAEEFRYLRSASIMKFIDIATYRPSKVNVSEARLAYRELQAISRKPFGKRDSILDTCHRAYYAFLIRRQYHLARELAPGLLAWVIVALKQSWLLPRLPPPSAR